MVATIGTNLLAAVRVMPMPAAVSPRRATRTLGLLWKVSTRSCLSFGCNMNNGRHDPHAKGTNRDGRSGADELHNCTLPLFEPLEE